jgi:MFS family permease
MEAILLLAAVVSVAVLHTLVPDHYLPISMVAQSRGWSTRKIFGVTMMAGIGHILASLVVGVLAVYVGFHFTESLASRAESLAKVMLIGFGLLYTVFALRSSRGETHHHHAYLKDNVQIPALILVLSMTPCIPAIPLFISASLIDAWTALFSMLVFSFFTITTMLAMVLITSAPNKFGLLPPIIRSRLDVISGVVIFATGILITIFNLKPHSIKRENCRAILTGDIPLENPAH